MKQTFIFPEVFHAERACWPGSGAILSSGGQYRYWLHRLWNETLPLCLWIGLNPSTADAMTNDATIRRMERFAKELGVRL